MSGLFGSPWWWPWKEVPPYQDKAKLLMLNANTPLPEPSNGAVWMGYIAVSPAGKPLLLYIWIFEMWNI
jgi:hypothetical protein